MASAVKGRGPAYDVRPVESPPFFGGPIGSITGFCKDGMQGACAGLLSLLGATHIAASPTPIASTGAGFESLPAILQNFSAGGIAGPVELLGGIVLFLAARRTVARTIGLLGFVGFLWAYANGYELPEMLSFLSDLLGRIAGALEASNQSPPLE